jgi:bifunctional UDP-N-acetylglucosamine pyrophosphorylase/glucosamine-1-phosphate N-acetyltransferase
MSLNVVIMAAGKGTRMKSARPKVLHRLAGRPLLQHVLDAAASLGASRTVIITGHGAEAVEAAMADHGAVFVRQMPQLGTGHAVQQAVPAWDAAAATTVVLNGDVPLIRAETVRALVQACDGRRLALLTVDLDDPTGYGRIVRGSSATAATEPDTERRPTHPATLAAAPSHAARAPAAAAPSHAAGAPAAAAIQGIVEHKDASQTQRAIREVYTGILAAPTAALARWVAALRNDNAQREYYLTDIVAMAVADGVEVVSAQPASDTEVLGVNSPLQLADLERRFQRGQAEALMEAGVRLADPARFDLRGQLICGQDVEIDVGCVFEGRVDLGDDVRIGAHCVIRDARIEAGAVIHPFTHIDGDGRPVRVGPGALVGPYARLRPGADLGAEVHIGNFVEVKNSTLARGAKANHLAYLGDATVGERVNYGAGSITANYDGANKHRTVIEADAHIGSNCVLVAPVTVGAGATIGAGSAVGKDAPAGQLTVVRARQVTVPGWKRPVKGR